MKFLYSISYEVDSEWKYLYGSLMLFSLCCGSVIPIIYSYSPKCRHHPAQIVLLLCLLEMIYCYQFFLDSVCFTDLIQFLQDKISYAKLLQLISFGHAQPSPQTLCVINESVILIALLAQLNYYGVLTIDFIITLKKPFWNAKLKLFYYNGIVILLTIIFFYFEVTQESLYVKCSIDTFEQLKLFKGNSSCNNQEIDKLSTFFLIQLFIIFILLIISLFVGVQDVKKMSKINAAVKENRKKLFINHIILFSTLFIVWSLPIVLSMISEANLKLKTILTRIHFAVLLLHPSIFLLIRLREPYFRSRTRLFFDTLTCKRKWKENKDKSEDQDEDEFQMPLTKLVQEQTNQETVQNILSSILRVVIYDQRLNDIPKQVKQKRKYKHEQNKFRNSNMESIESPLIESIGNSLSLTLSFEITEYSPAIFQDIREKNHIDHNMFQQSLRLDLNKEQIGKTQESLGKSGSFFFYTHDDALVLKTISETELSLLQSFLQDYHKYVSQNQSTLLAKIYGLFSINIEGLSKINLILMENIFQHLPQERIIYDLKGSLVNRKQNVKSSQVVDINSSIFQYIPSSAVMKDINFITSTDIFIELSEINRNFLFQILKQDLEFLFSQKLMDYSMLIGICTKQHGNAHRILNNHNKSFCFGIIDYTQKFTFAKKLELFYKIYVKRKGQQVSCVDPAYYKERFYAFINSVIIINDDI